MSQPTHGTLHHVELWVLDLRRALASLGRLLEALGYTLLQGWDAGRSWRRTALHRPPGERRRLRGHPDHGPRQATAASEGGPLRPSRNCPLWRRTTRRVGDDRTATMTKPKTNYPRGCRDDDSDAAGAAGQVELSLRGRDDSRSRTVKSKRAGLPPRVQGRQAGGRAVLLHRRTTPAGAGTTTLSASSPSPWPDYPRGCGDDQAATSRAARSVGLPPRVRGRLQTPPEQRIPAGTTPAGAGTTWRRVVSESCPGDYPRGCGDDSSATPVPGSRAGLPPRVRGRRGRW